MTRVTASTKVWVASMSQTLRRRCHTAPIDFGRPARAYLWVPHLTGFTPERLSDPTGVPRPASSPFLDLREPPAPRSRPPDKKTRLRRHCTCGCRDGAVPPRTRLLQHIHREVRHSNERAAQECMPWPRPPADSHLQRRRRIGRARPSWGHPRAHLSCVLEFASLSCARRPRIATCPQSDGTRKPIDPACHLWACQRVSTLAPAPSRVRPMRVSKPAYQSRTDADILPPVGCRVQYLSGIRAGRLREVSLPTNAPCPTQRHAVPKTID